VHVDGDGVVVGDEHRLRQVVSNLVANATAHTPPGTHVTLSVVGPADGEEVQLVVADDGPGMAPEVAARAFERFSRGDVARTRAAGSTGLGLSIVEAIVEGHGGSVALDSHPGVGTTVTVTLPRDL
jgi:two-component system OmpR family sensor kinase